jgi:4-hydroxythreonine-4-phosphate dehydrogenase
VKPLLLTPGDPRGIGPEVVVKTLLERRAACCAIVGEWPVVAREAERWSLPVAKVSEIPAEPPGDAVPVWDPESDAEPVEVAAVRAAAEAALAGRAAGLVTGPIHKGRLGARGFRFKGHTDFLGHLCGVEEPVMAFVGGDLRVVLVTIHVPLRVVPDLVSQQRVLRVLRIADQALAGQLGLAQRRLLVCGMNPHAGERGDMGTEEEAAIHPAVTRARQEGIDARGPMSAEAAFHLAGQGEGEMVVAMYHDQGLVPLKAVHFGHSVNWTLGLPIVRTSVDHGTADDIVGKGIADPASFRAALDLAERLTGSPGSPPTS